MPKYPWLLGALVVLALPGFSQMVERKTLFTTLPLEGGIALVVQGQTYQPYRAVLAQAITADDKHWALAVQAVGPDARFDVIVDGRVVGSYVEYRNPGDLALRSDGGAWSLRVEAPTNDRARSFRLVDGKAFGPFDNVEPVQWSPTGNGWVFSAQTGQQRFVVTGGKALGPYNGVWQSAWDSAGQKLALVISKADGTWLRLGDKETGPYNDARLLLRADGTWFGTSDQTKANAYEFLIADKKYGPYTWSNPDLDYHSADGTDWMTRAYKGAATLLLQNGKETAYNRIATLPLARGWLFTWEKGMGMSLNFNGKVFGPYENARDLTVTRDGSTWALNFFKNTPGTMDQRWVAVGGAEYQGASFAHTIDGTREGFSWVAGGTATDAAYQRWEGGLTSKPLYSLTRTEDGVLVKAGGQTFGPYLEIGGSPAVSPGGAHWGLLARVKGDRWVTLVDGDQSLSSRPFQRAGNFSMNANATAWSYVAWPDRNVDENQFRLVNGVESGPWAWAGPVTLSTDGTQFWYWSRALGKNGGNVLTFNGKAYGPFTTDQAEHLYDVDHGRFVFTLRDKNGTTVRMNDQVFGPYQDVRLLANGPDRPNRMDPQETGSLLGFIAVLKDGRSEVHIAPGNAGGGKTYGPYRQADRNGSHVFSADGQDWLMNVERDGAPNILLHNGVETLTQGFDLRPTATGYVMMVRSPEGEAVVENGKSPLSFTRVFRLWVSRQGTSWAAEVQQGDGPQGTAVVVDGVTYPGSGLIVENENGSERLRWFSVDNQGTGQWNTVTLKEGPR